MSRRNFLSRRGLSVSSWIKDGVCHDGKDRMKSPAVHRIFQNPRCVSTSEEPLVSFSIESENT